MSKEGLEEYKRARDQNISVEQALADLRELSNRAEPDLENILPGEYEQREATSDRSRRSREVHESDRADG